MIASLPQMLVIGGLIAYALLFVGALSGMFVICRAAVMNDELDATERRRRA